MAADVDVEALVRWPLSLVAQVPFAGEECLVAVFLERLGNGDLEISILEVIHVLLIIILVRKNHLNYFYQNFKTA